MAITATVPEPRQLSSFGAVAFSLVNRSTARDSRLRCVSSPVAFHAFRRQAELSGFEKAALARDRNAIGISATELPDWLADRSRSQ
jgi:hypothetical protein